MSFSSSFVFQSFETDLFYMSLVPEIHEVKIGVLGSGIDMGLSYLDPFLYVNPNEIAGKYVTPLGGVGGEWDARSSPFR